MSSDVDLHKNMLRQIAPEVFQISLMPRNSINCYIIEGILVDSGIRSSYNTVKKALQKIPVYQHILTHAHADHQGCSDRSVLSLKYHYFVILTKFLGLKRVWLPTTTQLRNIGWQSFNKNIGQASGHKVERTIAENDRIGNFQVIETPGHSPVIFLYSVSGMVY